MAVCNENLRIVLQVALQTSEGPLGERTSDIVGFPLALSVSRARTSVG